MDRASIVAEFVIGAGLGAFHGGTKHEGGKSLHPYFENHPDGHPFIKPHEVDIAQAVRGDIHDMVDSAPGIPTTGRSAEIHAHTLEDAIRRMQRGEEVRVDSYKMSQMTEEMIAKPSPDILKLMSPDQMREVEHLHRLDTQGFEQKSQSSALEKDPLSSPAPVYEQKMQSLHEAFADHPEAQKRIVRDMELSKKDIFNTALNCLFGVY